MDMKKVIKWLEEAETMLTQVVDCGDEISATIALNCLRRVVDSVVLLKKQEPKTGHWIDSAGYDKCSVCGATYSDLYPDYQYTHYCPNCGAKMIVIGCEVE